MLLHKTLAITLLFFAGITHAVAQKPAPKQLAAKRATGPIKIDGKLDEAAWKDAPKAEGYTEFRPTPFKQEDPGKKTEVYMLYTDEGLYLGGYCHEPSRDSISTEVTGRDGFGNNDFIGFIFDTYKDHINGFEYFVTPLGQQMDAKMSPNSNGNDEDFSWNAVWTSAAVIQHDGWTFEMFLPLSAIRFSTKNTQDWGMNITRKRQRTGQQYTWNPIDPAVNGFLTQEGYWAGLENIKPPLRLQFSPYFSTYVNHYPSHDPAVKNWTSSVNGGMDVKYGISQAFTLDMTLIPDFGQVQSDNKVLNTTPFEVKYNENRAFFTEGTELFNKGNFFYSRRVGGRPMHLDDVYRQLAPNETVLDNPSETKLINATKISGRMQGGLGIGFFNGVTAAQHATIEDDKGNQRSVETNPLTNYNIIVLNQSLKHNSSVSFVNTNVLRSGNDYDANVSAALFDFNDKTNMWNIGGKLANSNLVGYLPGNKTQSGYSHELYFGKTSGRFNFNIYQGLTDAKFNTNDLGYFTMNNFLDHSLWMGYKWNKPGTWYNRINLNFRASYSRRVKPTAYQNANINMNVNGQLKNLWFTGFFVGYEPAANDFYEPRVEGKVFRGWVSGFVDAWVETNNAKKYSGYAELLYVNRSFFHGYKFQINLNHKYRFSNKFSVGHSIMMEPQKNNVGFASVDNTNPIFGRRDRNTIENTLDFKYNFNNKLGITTRIRHYWSRVDYKEFFDLNPNGSLAHNSSFSKDVNQNYNAFNVDAVFTWQFGPGSFINIVWKNSIEDFNQLIDRSYFKNLNTTLSTDQNNNFSIKILYFLDYLQLKKKK
ncbi:MAG: DUF5916 domain-containing protein [Chitinophagaceae bacterium]